VLHFFQEKIIKTYENGRCRQVFCHLGSVLGGCWSYFAGGRCSEVDLVLKWLGWDLEWLFVVDRWPLFRGGR
jgi:hypothetical protein